MGGFSFKPNGPILKSYMRSEAFFRGIRGPVGSGKSAGSLIELYRRANQQAKAEDGKRYTRWVIVRNTNPQLRTTTIKTWLDWFPENTFGKFNWSPPYTHHIRLDDIDAEFIFLSMDREEDVRKLLSLEYTGGFANEARELPKSIIDAMTMRAGRYPSMKIGGPTWYGILADTNAPDDDHWWPIMAGDVPPPEHLSEEERMMLICPPNFEFYSQPGAMLETRSDTGAVTGYTINPDAENLKNLPKNYYPRIIEGKRKTWIDVYVMNRYGNTSEGRPVYPMFRKETHVAKNPILCPDRVTVYVGMDFGRTPAAIFGFKSISGIWMIFGEAIGEGIGARKFARMIKILANTQIPKTCNIEFFGDPSGEYGSDHDEDTYFQILRANGIPARAASTTNDPTVRIQVVEDQLNNMVDGKPGFLVSPECKILIKGFEGGYNFAKLSINKANDYDSKAVKNRYSHPHDALQYLLLGAGEGRSVLYARQNLQPGRAKRTNDIWSRNKHKKSRSRARI